MDTSIIGIGIALGVSVFILYTRKTKWMKPNLVWLICVGLLIIGFVGFMYVQPEFKNDRMMYFGCCVPIIYWIFDRLFKRISEHVHGRDFILFLRGSVEINDGFGAKNPHVKGSDKLFSLGLLLIIIINLVIGIQII